MNSQAGQSDQVLRKKKKLMQPGAPAGQTVQDQAQRKRHRTAVQQGQIDQGQTVKNKKATKQQLIQNKRHQGSATAQQGQNTTPEKSKKKQVGQARAGKTVTKTGLSH